MNAHRDPTPATAWVSGECEKPCPDAWVCRCCWTLLCPDCDAKPHTVPASYPGIDDNPPVPGKRAGDPCRGVAA